MQGSLSLPLPCLAFISLPMQKSGSSPDRRRPRDPDTLSRERDTYITSGLIWCPTLLSHVPGWEKQKCCGQKQFVTQASQEIPHPTTGWAQSGFTSEIRRDRVLVGCYERTWLDGPRHHYVACPMFAWPSYVVLQGGRTDEKSWGLTLPG